MKIVPVILSKEDITLPWSEKESSARKILEMVRVIKFKNNTSVLLVLFGKGGPFANIVNFERGLCAHTIRMIVNPELIQDSQIAEIQKLNAETFGVWVKNHVVGKQILPKDYL